MDNKNPSCKSVMLEVVPLEMESTFTFLMNAIIKKKTVL